MHTELWTVSRVASVLWVLGLLIFNYHSRGGAGVFITLQFAIWPVACIWLADYLGYSFGFRMQRPVAGPAPGIVFTVLGWILMVVFTWLMLHLHSNQR